jgi:hypothetical protein
MVAGVGGVLAHAANVTKKIDARTRHFLRTPIVIVMVYTLRTASVPTIAA